MPSELVPVGARTVVRALRTRAAAQVGPDWVWPYWLERQNDPASPSFVPRGHLPFLTNLTHRNWTAVGNLDSAARRSSTRAGWSPRGRTAGRSTGGSVPTTAGTCRRARWRCASASSAPRPWSRRRWASRPGTPSTRVRRPAQQRRGRRRDGRRRDRERVARPGRAGAGRPAVQPRGPGRGRAHRPARVHRGGRRPGGAAAAPPAPAGRGVDVPRRRLGRHRAGRRRRRAVAGPGARPRRTGPGGLRLPAGPRRHVPGRHPARPGAAGGAVPRPPTAGSWRLPPFPEALPPASAVAAGWQAQGDRGMRLVLPDDRLAEAVAANRRFLLLLHDGDQIDPPGPATYHRFWFRDAAYLLGARPVRLPRGGRPGPRLVPRSAAVATGSSSARTTSGTATAPPSSPWPGTGAWPATPRSSRGSSSRSPAAPTGSTASGGRAGARKGDDAALAGLLPAGMSAEHLGPVDHYYWDDFWGVAGLRAAAELLRAAGQPDAAEDAAAFASAMWADVEASLALTAGPPRHRRHPGGPPAAHRRGRHGVARRLRPARPAGGRRPAHRGHGRRPARAVPAGRGAFFQGISHSGLGTYLTMQLAAVELRGRRPPQHRPAGLDARRRHPHLDVARGRSTPHRRRVHGRRPPRVGRGRGAVVRARPARPRSRRPDPDDPTPDRRPVLRSCPPTGTARAGRCTARRSPRHRLLRRALARRPGGLLWEVDPHPGLPAVRLTAPGLEPSWSTTDPRGEALLGPVRAAADVAVNGDDPADAAAGRDVGLRSGAAPARRRVVR